jgi:hypothetical protein
MSWLRINIQTEAGSGELEIDSATPENKQHIIEGFMQVFGVKPNTSKPPIPQSTESPPVKKAPASKAPELPLAEKKKIDVPVAENPEPKANLQIVKPPLIGSSRTLETPIGELVSKSLKAEHQPTDSVPDHYKTGIKYKEGVPHYRCRYWCKNPDCKHKGNHYITEDETKVSCHECGEELKVRPAAEGKLQRDDWGNFFIADEPVQSN